MSSRPVDNSRQGFSTCLYKSARNLKKYDVMLCCRKKPEDSCELHPLRIVIIEYLIAFLFSNILCDVRTRVLPLLLSPAFNSNNKNNHLKILTAILTVKKKLISYCECFIMSIRSDIHSQTKENNL